MGEVTTVGFGEQPDGATGHIQVPDGLATLPQTVSGVAKLALRLLNAAECSSPAARWVLRQGIRRDWDLIVANDARVLDLAFDIAGKTPVWADLHEWAPEERTHITSWRLLVAPFMTHLCRRYLPRAALVTSVSEGICDLYREYFGVPAFLMTNAGPLRELSVQESIEHRISCVHSGAAIAGRGLESMIDVFRELPERYSLDLYLVSGGDKGAHLQELRNRAAGCNRIRFCDPVAPDELPATLNSYDLGIIWMPPTHTNGKLTLPNKFFDYIQARIGVAIGPSEEMVKVIDRFGLGVVAKSFDKSDLTRSIISLTRLKLEQFKRASDQAALPLSFESQSIAIRDELEALLTRT